MYTSSARFRTRSAFSRRDRTSELLANYLQGVPERTYQKENRISLTILNRTRQFFSFDRGTFQVLFSRKKVSQVLSERLTIHIDTRFSIFKILSKNLEILSKAIFNVSFLMHPL